MVMTSGRTVNLILSEINNGGCVYLRCSSSGEFYCASGLPKGSRPSERRFELCEDPLARKMYCTNPKHHPKCLYREGMID